MGSNCTIVGLNVMDVDPHGNGGLAKVVGGGPKHNNVTIRFISKPGEAMLFHVIVTGYCLNNYAPSFGWAEPLRSYNRYQYNASNITSNTYNGSATRFANYTLPAVSPNAPWWHLW